ncbi:hypothetical protein Glove_395g29 [Diversispora epigaea]|uniref:Uncharacterized protein n=1 Tax=Diversispora epigaea TaxID=1348612 RepID=A0A397H5M3_9GLOM|nr:hypothetical protein Glove_395g29 [Diversispora epigaea]
MVVAVAIGVDYEYEYDMRIWNKRDMDYKKYFLNENFSDETHGEITYQPSIVTGRGHGHWTGQNWAMSHRGSKEIEEKKWKKLKKSEK